MSRTYNIEKFRKGELSAISENMGRILGMQVVCGYPRDLYEEIIREPGGEYFFEKYVCAADVFKSGATGHILKQLTRRMGRDELVPYITYDGEYVLFERIRVSRDDLIIYHGIDPRDWPQLNV